jgi:hypothetical protein
MVQIYSYEQQDGLTDQLSNSNTIAYTSLIKPTSRDLDSNEKVLISKLLESQAMANPDQFDLYYLESVLVSVGWNHNDDVFDAVEVWKSRNTPVDKPFNYMHNEKDIIGHLTSSKVVDFEGAVIPDNALIDQLPNKFDVVVGSVLYKKWSDPDLQARINKLIAEIANNKWFVSMECLFRNFDYAVKYEQDGTEINKILARNEETAFLTKHLSQLMSQIPFFLNQMASSLEKKLKEKGLI